MTLVDGELSYGAGPFRWLDQAAKCDADSPVASTIVTDDLSETSSLLPITSNTLITIQKLGNMFFEGDTQG